MQTLWQAFSQKTALIFMETFLCIAFKEMKRVMTAPVMRMGRRQLALRHGGSCGEVYGQ